MTGLNTPKATFDILWAEGLEQPRMMSLGLHLRIIGRPGRIGALKQFLEYVSSKEGVWFATREQIAHHFKDNVSLKNANILSSTQNSKVSK